jgi:RNA 2',3'-cyclic 3'-phosphodiesterase
MVRLFSAIELPGSVRAELAERLHAIREAGSELRWVPPERWHITLGFYGDREHVDRRGTWFRRQAGGLAPARLRLRGAGRFPGVLWAGVSPMEGRDATALHTLAGALNADANASRYDFNAHVTLARWRRGAAGSRSAIQAVHELSEYCGSWWTAHEVVLFRSDQTGGEGPVYTPLDRVALASRQG